MLSAIHHFVCFVVGRFSPTSKSVLGVGWLCSGFVLSDKVATAKV